MEYMDLEKLYEKITLHTNEEFHKLHKFIDRRIAEVSSEVSASIQFMELNEENFNEKIFSLKRDLNEVLESPGSNWSNGGLELEYIADITQTAANNIMDKLDELGKGIDNIGLDDEQNRFIKDIIFAIYADCEFQDLVGQRVARIKERISDFDQLISNNFPQDERVVNSQFASNHKLNSEISQTDIDELFNNKREK